jgi:energy-coupling factor transporter ATP-binding protein EcfA2
MQLTAFRIFKYRNIEDSGLINLFDRLTCIVGKNQSGKTNLLRALQKLNPHDKSVKYDWRADWPRGGRRTRDERQVVCEAHFDLDAEHSELAAIFCVTAPPGRARQVSRGTRTAGGVQIESARQGGPRRLYQISLSVGPDATRRSRGWLLGRLIPDQMLPQE